MKLINENLKKTGIVNSILIVIALVLEASAIKGLPLFGVIDKVVSVVGLICGLLYSIKGYKKNAARYYKWFMYLFALRSLISFAISVFLVGFKASDLISLIHAINFAIFVCAFMLAFIKDFGEHNSKTAATIILVLSGIRLFGDVTSMLLFDANYVNVTAAIFVEAIIINVLVSQKYIDKASRGAK